MKLNKLKLQKGFTIIEVMIVLAIAGLIMVIVFLAVPQLQRSQRNTSRKSVVNRIKTEIDNFASNNTGNIPVAAGANAAGNFGDPTLNLTFAYKYFNGIDITDPQTGNNVLTAGNITLDAAKDNDAPAAGVVGAMLYDTGAVCKGELATTTGANGRNYALLINLEGKSVYCVDNH